MNQGCLKSIVSALFVLTGASAIGCGSTSDSNTAKTDDQFKAEVVAGMHDSILVDVGKLLQAAKDIQAAAPTTTGRGWDATQDAAAIQATKDAWIRARAAYEHVEGALAPIFPDYDASIDARYDDFLADPSIGSDQNLFDDQGVTGLHAVERILYVNETPAAVVAFEKPLDGYKAAAFPATEQEASDFKNLLCAKIVSDAQFFQDNWTPAQISLPDAFTGLVSLMNEQQEKVNKASTNEEESRYSQRTMADLRANLEGTKAIYQIFQSWLVTKENPTEPAKSGKQADGAIETGFAQLDTLYAQVSGDAIPQPPATWSAETTQSAADLATPFGKLYSGVHDAVNPSRDGSVVDEMNDAAVILGYPLFVEQP